MSYQSIQKNLGDIERKLTKSNKIVAKGGDMKLGDALKLGAKANSITSTIKKGIKDYQAFQPSEQEAADLIKTMESIVSLTETQIGLMVENKAHFDKLHVGGLVKKNLGKSDEAGAELADIMLKKAPESLKPQAEALNARRVAAFKKGISTFANATGGEDQADVADDSD